jgi:hypothetical protein
MTSFPAADDPIPATVFGTRSKPPGALGLLIRGVGAWPGQRAPWPVFWENLSKVII